MNRREFITSALASLAAASAIAGVVEAGMKAGPNMAGPGHHRLKTPGGAPLDGFTTPGGAYGFRKLVSAYGGAAMRLRRNSDNLELDIPFLGGTSFTGAPWDEATAAAHCAATTCAARWLYDQSGAAKDIGTATAASQTPLIFSCKGALPCLQLSNAGAAYVMGAATSITPATGVVSISSVAIRQSGTGQCFFLRENGNNNVLKAFGAGFWGYSTLSGAAAEGAWHAGQLVINGASSSVAIDGVTTTGTATGTVTAGSPGFSGVSGTVCNWTEGVLWDNVVLTPAQIAALTANQRAYWGI